MLKIQKVYKSLTPWSERVQDFLDYLHKKGFKKVPKSLGLDDKGQEIFSFVEGDTFDYPFPENMKSIKVLTSSAKLLREYHDMSQGYLSTLNVSSQNWMLPCRQPQEVICHNDFAPYNICYKGHEAVGIIDFETICPAPRIWDIAYALYRFAPFTNPSNEDGFGTIEEQISRACTFCNAYNLSKKDRFGLASLIVERLEALLNFLMKSAKGGDEKYQSNISDKHHLKYLADIEYIKKHREVIQFGLSSE